MEISHLLEAIDVALVHIRPDARIGAMNAPARAIFGAEGLGRPHISVLRQPALLKRIDKAMRTGEAREARYHRREAGRDVVWRVHIGPLAGGAEGLVLSFEDVTPVTEAREIRSDFVANVSHELRTPLTALTGFIETLQGPAADDAEARRQFLEIMARETERMNRMVDDLLSLSRLEAQARQRPLSPVDMSAVIREAADALAPMAMERDVRLVTDDLARDCAQGPIVPGDAGQLRQVITNLLENGIKYGREGGAVTVRARCHGNLPTLGAAGLAIDVCDEGEGISPRHLGRLTERFYRVDDHRSREMGGTGLGLAIVKHIVHRHRGRLRIASEPGEGSVFTVMLPFD